MTALWLLIKRVPSEAWIILGALIALWIWGEVREGQGRKAERDRLAPIIQLERENRELLEAELKVQNDKIEALRADERKARQAVQNAAKAGERIRGRVEPHVEPSRNVGPSGCDTAPEAARLWGAL